MIEREPNPKACTEYTLLLVENQNMEQEAITLIEAQKQPEPSLEKLFYNDKNALAYHFELWR